MIIIPDRHLRLTIEHRIVPLRGLPLLVSVSLPPRLMHPRGPTSLMKYVLFLSGHLDRPVSSLEQNDSTTAEKGGSVGWREVVLSLFPSICPLGSSVIPRRTRYSDQNMHFGESPSKELGESRNERPIRRAYLLLFQNTGKIPTNKYPSIRTTIKSSVNKTAFLL